MAYNKSMKLFDDAVKVIPGGVNSPVRAFGSVGRTPIFAKEAYGSTLVDVDDNRYIDYVCSWGPLILGHGSEIASKDLMEAINRGTTYGMPTEIEVALAKIIVDAFDHMDMIRMVSSGTEATMSALRLARGYTGRDKIIKFEGCYHGHSDGLLVKSGSGTLTGGVPTSRGVPEDIIRHTLVAEYNNMDSVKKLMSEHSGEIAAVIIEPIPGNMGLVEAEQGFLEGLRELCTHHDILLIFDEVITGFRVGFTGASGYYGISPDLTCFGKIIGGGMPVGAYGGRQEIMEHIAPLGGVYQAGTLSGNPIAMKMGLNVLTYLKNHGEVYEHISELATALELGFRHNFKLLDVTGVTINRVEGMLCQFFTRGPVEGYEQVMQSNTKQYAVYFNEMLEQGVLLPPAQFECMFLSTAHSHEDVERTIKCHYEAMKKVKKQWQDI